MLKESFSRKIIVSVVVVAILQMNQILPHVYIDDLRPKGKEYKIEDASFLFAGRWKLFWHYVVTLKIMIELPSLL